MLLDGADADPEPPRDRVVAQPLCHRGRHLRLAPAQPVSRQRPRRDRRRLLPQEQQVVRPRCPTGEEPHHQPAPCPQQHQDRRDWQLPQDAMLLPPQPAVERGGQPPDAGVSADIGGEQALGPRARDAHASVRPQSHDFPASRLQTARQQGAQLRLAHQGAEVRARQLEQRLLPVGEGAPFPVQHQSHDQRSPGRQGGGELVLGVQRAVDLGPEPQAVQLALTEEVGQPQRPAVPGAGVVGDDRVLGLVPLEALDEGGGDAVGRLHAAGGEGVDRIDHVVGDAVAGDEAGQRGQQPRGEGIGVAPGEVCQDGKQVAQVGRGEALHRRTSEPDANREQRPNYTGFPEWTASPRRRTMGRIRRATGRPRGRPATTEAGPMDPDRFDAFAKLIAAPRTRRGLLRAGLGGTLAGLAAAAGLRRGAPVAAYVGQVCSAAGIGPCQQEAAADYHLRVTDCAQNFGETAQVKLACLGSALEDYHFAQARCTPQACDVSACEVCSAAGTCQPACAPGVSCVGGRCGCPSDQTPCGAGCCAADQACCSHACCEYGITTCNPDGSCACPSGEKPCNGACIPVADCCTAADCPPNSVCQGGTCQQVGCRPLGETCGSDSQCCSGLCQFNACDTTTTTTTTPAPTTTTAPPTTTTSTTTTTTSACMPSGTPLQCSASDQGACCSGHCQG